MKKEKFLFGAILVLSFSFIHPYIYHFFVMKKQLNSTANQGQMIIGLGDYHDKNHPANKEQRDYIVGMIKKHKNCKLVVEDLNSVNNDGKGMGCNFIVNSPGGILGALADESRKNAVSVDNIEYRYCRVSSIGPLLRTDQSFWENIPNSCRSIRLYALKQEIFDQVEKIKNYDDGFAVNKMYKQSVARVMKDYKQLGLNDFINGTVLDYCSTLLKKTYRKKLEKICMFDSTLIDMKILHSIISSHDKSLIVIVAGGTHIDNVAQFLLGLGYKRLEQNLINNVQISGVHSAISTQKTASSKEFELPAIDLRFLNQFIQ